MGLTLLESFIFPRTEDLSRDARMVPFRHRPVVVLSPHFDDACFSLGCFLAAVGHGTLINIFTKGTYLARQNRIARAAVDSSAVFHIRDAEDSTFGERCGLTRHDLGCEEPSLLGRRPNDLRYIEDDATRILNPVITALDMIAQTFTPVERGFLFCPLGIGRHCNHRATAEMVLRQLAIITKRYDVLFYEDQPYAAKLIDRFHALRRVSHAGALLSVRHVLVRAWHEKKDLIGLYPSQFRRSPRRRMFWPAVIWPYAPHEAFWSLGNSTS